MAKWTIALLGTAINLALISVPQLLLSHNWAAAFADPLLAAWYLLISSLCLAESLVGPVETPGLSGKVHGNVHKPLLPYLSGVVLLGLIWMVQLDNFFSPSATLATFAAGAALCCLGIALRVAAIVSLGPLFISHIALLPEHRLITHGLYAWLRHPSELGLLLICLGLPLALNSAVGFASAVLVAIPISIYRIRLENALLANGFPASYANYRRSTPALMPGVSRLYR